MQVNVARTPMRRVFEVVVLEIGDRMAHVVLARHERLFPDHPGSATDAARAFHVRRQGAGPQLRTDRAGAELRMGEIQVVLSLGHVVGELVADGEAEPSRYAGRIDQVQADELGLLAAVEREYRRGELGPAAGHDRAIALVEPFGLRARRRTRGTPAF